MSINRRQLVAQSVKLGLMCTALSHPLYAWTHVNSATQELNVALSDSYDQIVGRLENTFERLEKHRTGGSNLVNEPTLVDYSINVFNASTNQPLEGAKVGFLVSHAFFSTDKEPEATKPWNANLFEVNNTGPIEFSAAVPDGIFKTDRALYYIDFVILYNEKYSVSRLALNEGFSTNYGRGLRTESHDINSTTFLPDLALTYSGKALDEPTADLIPEFNGDTPTLAINFYVNTGDLSAQ